MKGKFIQNRFRIDAYLGRGATSGVYRVEDSENPDRELCIKIFLNADPSEAEIARFYTEFHLASRLHHPQLLRLYESGLLWPERKPYFVAEYFAGQSMAAHLKQRPGVDTVIQFSTQLFSVLGYLHEHQLLHMDIKPSNILVSQSAGFNNIKLIDYGTLQIQNTGDKTIGTLFYMSPSVLQGKKHRSSDDLYSCGVVLYQWLVGSLPYADMNPEDFVGKVRLGWHPFTQVDFSECGVFSSLVNALLFQSNQSAEKALEMLGVLAGGSLKPVEYSFSLKPRFSPPIPLSPDDIKTIEDFLEHRLFSGDHKQAGTLTLSGPLTGKPTAAFLDAVVNFAQRKKVLVERIPTIPDNSVVSTVRTLAERYQGMSAFSGLGPQATIQALTAAKDRRLFFEHAFEMIRSIVGEYNRFVLILENADPDDLYLFEFITALQEYCVSQQLALAVVVSIHLHTPVDFKSDDFALRNCYLHSLLQEAQSVHFALPVKPRGEAPLHKPSLIALLSLLPQPIAPETIKTLIQYVPQFKDGLLDLEQRGLLARDEDRYYYVGNTDTSVNEHGEIAFLNDPALTDSAFLPALCWFFPTAENAAKLLKKLGEQDDSDQYFPDVKILENFIAILPEHSPMVAAFYYHIGRTHSFLGRLTHSKAAFTKALEESTHLSAKQRFLTAIEFANVHAKGGDHLSAARLLEKASLSAPDSESSRYADGLLQLSCALHLGPKNFPIGDFSTIFQSLARKDLAGRLAMRYGQALLWANCSQEAFIWLQSAREYLCATQHRFREARCLRMLARIYRDRGDLEGALVTNETAYKILKNLSFPKEELETLIAIFYVHRSMGRYDLLDGYLCRISKIMSILPSPAHELLWPELLAIRSEKNNPKKSLYYYRLQETLAKTYDSQQYLYIALSNRALLEKELGEAIQARQTWNSAKQVFEDHGTTFPPRLQRGHKELEVLEL